MLFNSLDFAVFLPIVFFLYWFALGRKLHIQNLLLVVASYIFYGWWDWRFLSLIFFSTIVDFYVGIGLLNARTTFTRKLLLSISIVVNLGFLGIFKYYNFFIDNLIDAFSLFGAALEPGFLKVILPVGISFYTFQTLSYSIDVYKRKIVPTSDLIAFMAFVCFFPQLVAGPIERATHLLPQFYTKRKFVYSKAVDGMRQVLWGFLKKIVIADNCAIYANMIFNNSSEYSGSTLVLGALFFTFQIYGDFSGYSDIAIGISRIFGFSLMKNFAFPYFSRDIAEFWRRWHISLSTWFRDYLYIPLGGSSGSIALKVRNTLIIFIISGLWHGANWTFVFWGALNAIYFIPLLLGNKNRKNMKTVSKDTVLPSSKEFVSIMFTFSLTVFAWIFFRSSSISQAFQIVASIFSKSLFTIPVFPARKQALITMILVMLFMVIEWFGRDNEYAIEKLNSIKRPIVRQALTLCLSLVIASFGNFGTNEFIYFQF
jgi:D-alanyl-lipoteichoic acid acyltransferase DltB (MBOAT superfamily)